MRDKEGWKNPHNYLCLEHSERKVVKNEKKFFSLVKGIFAQRRKTLVNSLSNSVGMSKAEIQNALSKMGLEPTVRAENLTMEEIVALSDLLLK